LLVVIWKYIRDARTYECETQRQFNPIMTQSTDTPTYVTD